MKTSPHITQVLLKVTVIVLSLPLSKALVAVIILRFTSWLVKHCKQKEDEYLLVGSCELWAAFSDQQAADIMVLYQLKWPENLTSTKWYLSEFAND
jgi:hypothetical protein